ncbi:MAG: hypothetical protein DYG92_10365 [Leptolyngbya sp. PLA1]|nr:hypothetical protein [Leptolyngbya sp. PLA1]
MRRVQLAVLAVGACCGIATAQPFAIDWFTIDGGGGTSSGVLTSGETISISGTIGQPDAGASMTGGGFTVVGGFWAFGGPTQPPICDPDYNQDGNVDQDDVRYLVDVIAGGENPTGRDPDFNLDGNVDQDDFAALVDVIAGGPCP